MKNTSFKRLWTMTSLKRIRKELQMDTQSTFLCVASLEFKAIWREYQKEIKTLAESFIGSPLGRIDVFNSLFRDGGNNFPAAREARRKIRLEFLDHEIARLSKK